MLLQILLFSGVLYLGLAALAHFASDSMIFLPPPASYDAQRVPVTLVKTADGAEIAVLHLPNPDAQFTLLYSHGNAEDLGHLLPVLELLRDAGFGVVAYDYRGYGLSSSGPPTAAGVIRDEQAVYEYAVGTLGVQPARLIVHGRSLGTGPASDLAAREPVAGLILESGFVSAFRVMTGVRVLPFDKFPNRDNLRGVRCPVLVIHGLRDEVIAFWHGEALFAAAAEPKRKYWVDSAGHNNLIEAAGVRYAETLREFALLVAKAATTAPAAASR